MKTINLFLQGFKFSVVIIPVILAMGTPARAAKKMGSAKQLFEMSLTDLFDMKIQTGSFLDLNLMNSSLSMTIIDENQIQVSGARHLSELLEIYVPGFQYMFNKWNGEVWGMRGVAADRNTKFIFLVNGHKMNTESRDGFLQETNIGLLQDIKRVEVLRGPAGLVYGSGAISGIVNIVTKKYDNRDETGVSVTLGTWDFSGTNREIQGHAFRELSEDHYFSYFMGYRVSDGIPAKDTRLWGRPHFPYPQDIDPVTESVPAAGCSWCTPGNWKIDLDWEYGDINFHARVTHQVSNAGGLFVVDPWPEIHGHEDTTGPGRWIDGVFIPGFDSVKTFWRGTESWNTNRRQYRLDNVMAELTYKIPLVGNNLDIKLGFDGLTSRIQLQSREGYESFYPEEKGAFVEETFGEKRYILGATYQMNTMEKLQLAIGYEFGFYAIGDDLTGKNSQREKALHPIVSEVNYINNAYYFEGLYSFIDEIALLLGARYEVHTRTVEQGGVFTPKTALLIKPTEKHSFKLIYQSSANNGSADNYEYNRNNFDDNGKTYEDYHFERPAETPGENSVPIPGVTEKELHKLKPEKVQSAEFTSVHQFLDGLVLQQSLSWNRVSNLFVWNQQKFRVINSGEYEFINAEFDVKHTLYNFTFGVNHAYQGLWNMELSEQDETTLGDKFAEDNFWETYTDPTTKETMYRPVPLDEKDTIVSNAVKSQVTVDGKNFLNLATHLSKFYCDLRLAKGFMLHTDARLFWGLPGRQKIFEKYPKYQFLGLGEEPMVKWNVSLHWSVNDDIRVSAYAYDLLAESKGDNAIHSFRWQQSGNSDEHTDIFGVDQRSFAFTVEKSF